MVVFTGLDFDMPSKLKPDIGLAELLQQQLRRFSSEIAIEQSDRSFTFSELDTKGLALARELHRLGIRKEEPIAVLAPRGVDHILAQIAVVYSGGSCVPLDVDLPDEHINNLLLNLNASVILTDARNQHRLPTLQHVVVDSLSDQAPEMNITVSDNEPLSCSHIFHTSGSTGQPKAVQVLAMGVMNLVFNDFAPISTGSRVAHVCNIGFDVSLWEIWSSLLHGATLIIFQKNEVLDPLIFERRLQHDRIDVMWQTTSLLATIAHTCPRAYSHVGTLLTGGEAINIQTIRTIMANGPPKRLLNVYGPTELSVFATYHEISSQDVESGHIPIGRPLSNYETFVVDEHLLPVPTGSVGELLVGGAGVAAGYFNQAEKTAKVFVRAPHLAIRCKVSTGLYYRTGDLVRQDDMGDIEYLGRRDNEVKIRGQRVDLESIESCLLETKLVSSAVALRIALDEPAGGSMLLAYVIPTAADVDATSIRNAYVQLAPHLMIPRLQVVESLTLTRSGKVDRKELARDYTQHLHALKAASTQGQPKGAESVEDFLQKLWQELLGLPVNSLQGSDDFFSLGGTSLQAALLVSKVQQGLGLAVRVAALFEHSTLQGMCALLTRAQNGASASSSTADSTDEVATWLRDCQLGRDLEPMSHSYPDWRAEGEGKVFMTGVTGFIGAFFLASLLKLPQVKTVACLVRANDRVSGLIRIRKILNRYRLVLESEQEAKILALPGDLGQEKLGLDAQQYEHFAKWTSVVFHLGAHINFVQPYSSHRAANVQGTLNTIHFANSGRCKTLHYTSSISAYGPTGIATGCTHLPENEKPVSHIRALSYDTGYAQSQMVAESIVWNAIERGLPIAIHRLGFVLGHSETGTMSPDDFFGRLMTSSIKTGCYPILPRHREDIVPVDFVVSALLHIASDPKNLGQAYNLVHPDPDSSIDLSTTFELINSLNTKTQMREVPYSEWIATLSRIPDTSLRSLMPMLEEKVFGDRTRWQMQQDMPEFAGANTLHALSNAPELLVCSPPSALIAKYFPFWAQAALV